MPEDKTNKLSALAGGLATIKPPIPKPPIPVPQIPLPPGGLSGLSSGLQTVSNMWFNGQPVQLDGYRFINCRFDKCTLHVNSANFEILSSLIDPSCRIQYGRGLSKVIQLFSSRFPLVKSHFPSPFTPLDNPDGTVSIMEWDK